MRTILSALLAALASTSSAQDKLESAPPYSAAPTFNVARASIGRAIYEQLQPCADRQPYIGEGANQITLTINAKLARNGRLISPPVVLRASGDAGLRAKYGALLETQVRRIFADCSPLRLPADLYNTPTGGWSNITFTYRVK